MCGLNDLSILDEEGWGDLLNTENPEKMMTITQTTRPSIVV